MLKKINPKNGADVHDVIVIGARCAGSPLAMLLAHSKGKPLLRYYSRDHVHPGVLFTGEYQEDRRQNSA